MTLAGSNAGDQPSYNTARNALYYSPAHQPVCNLILQRAAVLSYTDQRDMSMTHGGQLPHYGAKHPSVPSSADIICIREKFVPNMLTYCDPHISHPPDMRGQNCP